jgi:hypothetical protein
MGKAYRFQEILDGDDNLDDWDNLDPPPVRTEAGLEGSIARRKATNPDDPAIATLEQQLADLQSGRSQGDSGTSGATGIPPAYFKLPGDKKSGGGPQKRPEVVGKYFTIPGE